MVIAFGLFALAAMLVLAVERHLLAWSSETPVTEWLTRHLYSPLLRALVVLTFVFAAYPQLFGLEQAPPLGNLLAGGHNRFDALINWLLLVSLLLPMAPFAERLPGLMLPVQGVAASCVLFSWLAAEQGTDVDLWMGWRVAAEVLAIGVAASVLARALAGRRAAAAPYLIGELALLLAQLPAIMIYAGALGRQLH